MERSSALLLVELIYAAALEPARWQDFAKALSESLGGAPTGFALQVPGSPFSGVLYAVGFSEPSHDRLMNHVLNRSGWRESLLMHFAGRFGLASDVVSEEQLASSAFYRECMAPQGLVHGPMGHLIAVESGRPVAGVVAFPAPGRPPFGREELEIGNLLVPHLALSYRIHSDRRQQQGLSDAIDRFPTGLLLLDVYGHVVRMNRAAAEILEMADGLVVEKRALCAYRSSENSRLHRAVASVIGGVVSGRTRESSVMTVTRRSGRRAFPLVVAPLRARPREITRADAVAVVYVADLERGAPCRREALRELYGLTDAETRLVELLCQGCSLEESAEARGVTMNTARSQLKQVFSKTCTSRQSELVRLVLAGVTSIGDP